MSNEHRAAATRTAPRPQPSERVLSTSDLLKSIQDSHTRKARPEGGWRRLVYDITNGRYNPGPSEEEVYEAQLIKDIQTPIREVKHVAVWAQKGGVGKTTTTAALGITTAQHRTDKILALDVNPDGGSLAIRVPSTTRYNILDLRDALRSGYVAPNDFDRYVNHAAHRLDSIVMPPGEKVHKDQILTGDDYKMIAEVLEKRYPYKIIFTDCGTNLTDSVMDGVIPRADQLIVVTTTVMDEATVTAGGLEALAASGYADLVSNAITVVVNKAPRDPNAEVQREIEATASTIREHFQKITSELISVPYDPRIRIGGIFDPAQVSKEFNTARLELARATVLRLAAQDGY